MSDFKNKKGTEAHGSSENQNCVFDWTSGETLAENAGREAALKAGSPVVLESDIISDAK